MEQEEIAIAITGNKKEIGSLKHRMDEVEEMVQSINNLAISVEKLAMSVSTMIDRQDKYDISLKTQGERIGELERADGEKWKNMVKTILAVVVTGVVGFAMAKIGF